MIYRTDFISKLSHANLSSRARSIVSASYPTNLSGPVILPFFHVLDTDLANPTLFYLPSKAALTAFESFPGTKKKVSLIRYHLQGKDVDLEKKCDLWRDEVVFHGILMLENDEAKEKEALNLRTFLETAPSNSCFLARGPLRESHKEFPGRLYLLFEGLCLDYQNA